MKVSIKFEFDALEDGIGGVVTYEEDDISDLYQLARFYAFATSAAGYTYVENVGFEKEDGTVTFG